jgi:Carboxypeptidase regulatory-like domain
MKKLILLFTLLWMSAIAFGQAGGYIYGVVTKGGKKLENVTIEAFEGGILKGSATTNQFGAYEIKPLSAGSYEVKFSFSGLTPITSTVLVSVGGGSRESVDLAPKQNILPGGTVKVSRIRKKLEISTATTGTSIDAKKIEKMATTNAIDGAALSGGTYQAKKGDGPRIGGGRAENTLVVIDGIAVRNGGANLPPGSIAELTVNAGGLPANLGDATGGVISITTKGTSAKHTGSFNFQHSVDGYNNNQLNFTIRGPLYKKKVGGKLIPVLGYALSVNGAYDADPDPSYYKYYSVSDATLANLQANPLRAIQTSSGSTVFRNSAEYLTESDLIRVKSRLNAYNRSTNFTGKISFAPNKDMEITLGGNGSYSNNPQYRNSSSILTPESNVLNSNFGGRAYVRFRQTLSKESATPSLIGKAFYTVQLNYETVIASSMSKKHKENPFGYGYIGKFTQYEHNIYIQDTVSGQDPAGNYYYGMKFLRSVQDSIKFQPNNEYNPNYTPYTSYVFNNLDKTPKNLNDILEVGGLGNGSLPTNVFNLFNNVGSGNTGFNKSQTDQYSLNVDASFDINTGLARSKALNKDVSAKHSIEFGFYYEQRRNSSYNFFQADRVWNLMRSLTNQHILEFDFANPIFRVDGQDYTLAQVQSGVVRVSAFDTINFDRKVSAKDPESFFSKNLRKALGLGEGNKDFINIDDVDPNKLTTDMFSADDLLNQGAQYATWSGYDHLGNKLKSRPSFQDFWTKKDANGNYARPIAPFNPIYVAGYIQDNFKFNDIRFRVGVRIDRYDANQKVLKDPYSLVATQKVKDLKAGSFVLIQDPSGAAPDPINNNDFKTKFADANVYVDNNDDSKPKIVGYRIGDVWYDAFGGEVSDPSIITSTYFTKLAPFITNKADIKSDRIQNPNFDVNSSFTDYKPRINVSPRIMFSFPVDVSGNGVIKSMFYAHYDVVTQRPGAGSIYATPDDYFYIDARAQSQTLANANLNPEKKVDYEFGFQQQLSPSSLLKLSAAYIERRDQIQIQKLVAAWPLSYETYGNRDFSTVKQMIVQYELRPDRVPLEMTAAYTLQFAEGTGSSSTSQRTLIAAGVPNLRQPQPLDIDSRHTFVINADYRLGSDSVNRGPRIGRFYPFQNVGINSTISARSGEPYTKLLDVTSLFNSGLSGNTISGSPFGSRRPWNFNIDMRIDKDFVINAKGKKLVFNVYSIIQNVLNTRNVLNVYNFSGLADNDGFLTSPQGITAANAISTSKDSWASYYNIALRNPNRFVNPRRIFIGINFNF